RHVAHFRDHSLPRELPGLQDLLEKSLVVGHRCPPGTAKSIGQRRKSPRLMLDVGGVSRVTLYEDDRIVALAKPAGVSMATSSKAGKSETRVVARLLDACGEGGRDRGLFLVHRLDVGTSGVVLLARSAEAHRALSAAFQDRHARKTYRALVWGHPRP